MVDKFIDFLEALGRGLEIVADFILGVILLFLSNEIVVLMVFWLLMGLILGYLVGVISGSDI